MRGCGDHVPNSGGLVATLLLITGLLLGDRLNAIESMAAVLQTLPVLVIVTLSLIVETQTARLLNLSPSASSYCFFPVTVALMFPPLANGAGAIRRIPINLKAMLRLWDCPSLWRIRRVYIPLAIPDILTGVRASSTWAVGATLIAEGLLNGVNGDSKTLGHFLVRLFSSSVLPGRTPAVIVIATLLGFLVYFMFAVIQRYAEKRLRGDVAAAEAEYPLHAMVQIVRVNLYENHHHKEVLLVRDLLLPCFVSSSSLLASQTQFNSAARMDGQCGVCRRRVGDEHRRES